GAYCECPQRRRLSPEDGDRGDRAWEDAEGWSAEEEEVGEVKITTWVPLCGSTVMILPHDMYLDEKSNIVEERPFERAPYSHQRVEHTYKEGATINREYVRAALVICPNRHRYKLLSKCGSLVGMGFS